MYEVLHQRRISIEVIIMFTTALSELHTYRLERILTMVYVVQSY
jgi:hypothetical protein